VLSSGSSTRPFPRLEGQDPFWSIGIFRWDLFGAGSGVEITVSPAFPETSDPDVVPFTTAYYFPGSEALQADHILTIPLEMVHYIDPTSIHTGIIAVSQAPIGTPLLPSVTPTLPPGYRALNASIPTPTQTPSGTLGGPSSSGHSPLGFILTLPQPPFGGPFSSSTNNTNPSGTIPSFTPYYQIPVGGKFHQGGLTQPPLVGKIPIGTKPPIGTQPPIGRQPPPTPPYGQNIPPSLAQYWNHLIQHNPQSTRGATTSNYIRYTP
jgi:hypothetical protein